MTLPNHAVLGADAATVALVGCGLGRRTVTKVEVLERVHVGENGPVYIHCDVLRGSVPLVSGAMLAELHACLPQ